MMMIASLSGSLEIHDWTDASCSSDPRCHDGSFVPGMTMSPAV
jgi:hypothetical protein